MLNPVAALAICVSLFALKPGRAIEDFRCQFNFLKTSIRWRRWVAIPLVPAFLPPRCFTDEVASSHATKSKSQGMPDQERKRDGLFLGRCAGVTK